MPELQLDARRRARKCSPPHAGRRNLRRRSPAHDVGAHVLDRARRARVRCASIAPRIDMVGRARGRRAHRDAAADRIAGRTGRRRMHGNGAPGMRRDPPTPAMPDAHRRRPHPHSRHPGPRAAVGRGRRRVRRAVAGDVAVGAGPSSRMRRAHDAPRSPPRPRRTRPDLKRALADGDLGDIAEALCAASIRRPPTSMRCARASTTPRNATPSTYCNAHAGPTAIRAPRARPCAARSRAASRLRAAGRKRAEDRCHRSIRRPDRPRDPPALRSRAPAKVATFRGRSAA